MGAQPLTLLPWSVDEFTGGLTDNYVGAGKNKYQYADNFVITDERKLLVRPGSEVVDTTHYLPGYTLTSPRVGCIFSFQDQIFEVAGRHIYYNSSGYAELLGPVTSNPALYAGTEASRTSFALWNNHLLITNDALGKPMKIYKDSGGTFRVRTAGLPAIAAPTVTAGTSDTLSKACALANRIKQAYNNHINNGANVHNAIDATNTIAAVNATTLAQLKTLTAELLTDYTAHEKDGEKASGWTYHYAQEGSDHSLTSIIAPTTLGECVDALNALKAKYNTHNSDVREHHDIFVGASGDDVETADVETHNYIYSFLYFFSYTVGNITFQDFGPTTQVTVSDVDKPDVTNAAISSIAVLANSTTDNYDTATITVKIYRTEDAGLTSYYVGQVTNGTTTYTDSTSDATLATSTVLYTDGGVLDNDPPPKCKYVVVANNMGWYFHTSESSSTYPTRIRQSVQFDFDSVPGSFYKDLESPIVGVGVIGIYPIVFCQDRIYRIEGFFDLTGRGDIEPREIIRSIGGINHNSIVQTRYGLFFAGTDGFYFTDGYSVTKVSKEFNATYKAFTDTATKQGNIYGMFEAVRNRIWWTVQSDSSSSDNDACYVADLNYGISENMPFTTFSGGTSFAPTALLYYNNTVYRADKRGYLLTHDEDLRTDPKIDTSAVPSAWVEKTIIYNYVSAAWDFGNESIIKWVPKMTLYAKNASNASVGIKSLNDITVVSDELKEIRISSNILWEDETVVWGDDTLIWNYDKVIKVQRRFPAGGLRCSYKQIQLTNSYTIITNSDSLGVSAVNASLKTVTLSTAPTNIWPSQSVDYYISFEEDDYTQDFLVTARTSSVLTYSDPGNVSVTAASSKWLLRGYRKGDVLSLLNFSLYHGFLSDSQSRFHTSETGSNA